MTKPDYAEIRYDLVFDYRNNARRYSGFHTCGTEAFKRDLPKAMIKFVDSGHFALETHYKEIAKEIGNFIG